MPLPLPGLGSCEAAALLMNLAPHGKIKATVVSNFGGSIRACKDMDIVPCGKSKERIVEAGALKPLAKSLKDEDEILKDLHRSSHRLLERSAILLEKNLLMAVSRNVRPVPLPICSTTTVPTCIKVSSRHRALSICYYYICPGNCYTSWHGPLCIIWLSSYKRYS